MLQPLTLWRSIGSTALTPYHVKGIDMKKPATQEQKDKAAERRAKMRELARSVSAMTPDERNSLAARMPVATIEGRTLSPFNCCFVTLQMSGATIVGGFRQWRTAGRAVRKGERGLSLWVPLKRETSEDNGEADDVRFMLGTVFDVSQTEEVEGGLEQEAA